MREYQAHGWLTFNRLKLKLYSTVYSNRLCGSDFINHVTFRGINIIFIKTRSSDQSPYVGDACVVKDCDIPR